MSYILDALRKADAQRERNPARGIHAQAAARPGAVAGPRASPQWPWAGAAALLVIAAAWLWSSSRGDPPPPVAAGPGLPVVEVVLAPAAPAAVVLPAAPAPVVVEIPEVRRPVVRAQQPESPPGPAAAVPAPAPAAAERTYTLAELPSDVQQAMPKLAISGGVYSENVAQRMLVVNGQVFNEGSEVAPGVVLEQVRPRNALLKFRGLRITQPY